MIPFYKLRDSGQWLQWGRPGKPSESPMFLVHTKATHDCESILTFLPMSLGSQSIWLEVMAMTN